MTLLQAASYAPKARINGIALGPVIQGANERHFQKRSKQNIMNMNINISDIFNAITFLECSSSVTGQVIFIDNGKHIIKDSYT